MNLNSLCSLLMILTWGCGDRAAGGEPTDLSICQQHADVGLTQSDHDKDCIGNVGCTEQLFECNSCHCVLCDGERCLSTICDDSCLPSCPGSKPEEGVPGCPQATYAGCKYPVSCPCGPAALVWRCNCSAQQTWTCYVDECLPCPDAHESDSGGMLDSGVP